VWRYEELGLGANVNAEIARAPEVVDLMISLACAGVNSGRGDVILDPFPMADFAVKGTKDLNSLVPPQHFARGPSRQRSTHLTSSLSARVSQKSVLEGLPSVVELSSATEIRPFLDLIDPSPSVRAPSLSLSLSLSRYQQAIKLALSA
jgi:hypothetical protein